MRIRFGVAIMLAVALLASASILSGCQSAAEKTSEAIVEGATGVDVDSDENKVTIEGEDGESMVIQSGTELPEGFPSDAPVYAADIEGSSSVAVGDATAWTVAQTTSDSFNEVVSYLTDELTAAGWTENGNTQSSTDGSSIAMIGATKGSMRYTVSVQQDGSDDVTIAISVNDGE